MWIISQKNNRKQSQRSANLGELILSLVLTMLTFILLDICNSTGQRTGAAGILLWNCVGELMAIRLDSLWVISTLDIFAKVNVSTECSVSVYLGRKSIKLHVSNIHLSKYVDPCANLQRSFLGIQSIFIVLIKQKLELPNNSRNLIRKYLVRT